MDDFIDSVADGLLKLNPIVGLFYMFKNSAQAKRDAERDYRKIIFPNEFDQKNIEAFASAIGSHLRSPWPFGAVDSIVFELWASAGAEGVQYRIRVPKARATYLLNQLHGALDGLDTQPVEPSDPGFQSGITIHMKNPSEELPLNRTKEGVEWTTQRIIHSLQDAVEDGDAVMIQWVVTHSSNQKMPPSDEEVKSLRSNALDAVFGSKPAGRDETQSRRNKQVEQNFGVIGRVAARGKTVERARQLVYQVEQALTAERDYAYLYSRPATPRELSHDIAVARTPLMLPIQFNTKDLVAHISWPFGGIYVPGVQRGSVRHMPVPVSVSSTGIIIGKTTRPNVTRNIAISLKRAVTHSYIGGGNGTGKTTLMLNMMRQMMDQNCGVILFERDGNLFRQALDEVPPHRRDDVICIDLTRQDRPVGFNVLHMNKPEIVAGQFAQLLDSVFPDSQRSVYTSQLVLHGVPLLAELDRATIADLVILVHPRTPADKAWVKTVVSQTKDKAIRQFWEDWHKQDDSRIMTNAQAFKSRINEVLTPEPIRYLLNQETSSFNPVDVLTGNKLLFVNLAGISEQAASLIGSVILESIWTQARREEIADLVPEDRPNFIFLDECQQFFHLKNEIIDMFATARKRRLGLVAATQYIERLDPKVQDAVLANARNKIIFQSSVNSARVHAQEFAHAHVDTSSFVNLKAYTALARINTDGKDGVSDPMTMYTYPEPGAKDALIPNSFKQGRDVLEASLNRYGRSVADIRRDDETRRRVTHTTKPRPSASVTPPNEERLEDFFAGTNE